MKIDMETYQEACTESDCNETDWYEKIGDKASVQDLLALCLSNSPFTDKALIIDGLNSDTYDDTEGMKWLEGKLERAGQEKLVQLLRYMMNNEKADDAEESDQAKWSKSIIEADIESRWVAQRSIYLQEQVDNLVGSPKRKSATMERGRSTDTGKGDGNKPEADP